MAPLQYIADGYTQTRERAVLWRTWDYTYHIEIGWGTTRRRIDLVDTPYESALAQFRQHIVELVELA